MENYIIDFSSFFPAICAVFGVVIGAKFGTRNKNYILKLRPTKRFINENYETLFGKITDEVGNAKSTLQEYVGTDEKSDAYKRFGLRLQLAEKVLDIEVACETLLKKLGFDKETATILRMKVNRKNEKLDYFEEPIGELLDLEHQRLDKEAFMEEHNPNYKSADKG